MNTSLKVITTVVSEWIGFIPKPPDTSADKEDLSRVSDADEVNHGPSGLRRVEDDSKILPKPVNVMHRHNIESS